MAPPTLLLTRPHHSAEAFRASLDPEALACVRVMVAPLMEIVGTTAKPQLDGVQGVIFTSANAVFHAPEGAGRPAFCVGAGTTEAALARGWAAQQLGDTARDLIAALLAKAPAAPLLHLAGVHTRGDIAQTLTAAGIKADHLALYQQKLLPLETQARKALQNGPCIVPVFSPRTASQLLSEAGDCLKNAHIVALSGAVAEVFPREKCAGLMVMPEPQAVYMRKAVENLCKSLCLP